MQEAHEQKERNMNLQTMENTMPKTAQNVASQLIFSSKRMAQNCGFRAIISENLRGYVFLFTRFWKTPENILAHPMTPTQGVNQ